MTPNVDCMIYIHSEASFNRAGEPQLIPARRERCAIIRLHNKIQHTTVRADSGASRGHAEEETNDCKVLLQVDTVARVNDKIVVAGIGFRVLSLFPRFDLNGTLDHFECMGEAWA